MLVFRKDVWPDLFFDGNDSVNIPTATSVELATITDTPSTSQDAIFIGWMSMTTDGGDDNAFLWARENGSTVVPPDQSVTANQRSRDATDLLPVGVIGAVALDGSALDLDMFGSHSDDSTLQATTARFLVWGMTTTASPPDPPDPTTPIRVMRSPRYGITRSATR